MDVYILVSNDPVKSPNEWKYISYQPVLESYRTYVQCGRLKYWDVQINPNCFTDKEKSRFFMRKATDKELYILNKKYKILNLSSLEK